MYIKHLYNKQQQHTSIECEWKVKKEFWDVKWRNEWNTKVNQFNKKGYVYGEKGW